MDNTKIINILTENIVSEYNSKKNEKNIKDNNKKININDSKNSFKEDEYYSDDGIKVSVIYSDDESENKFSSIGKVDVEEKQGDKDSIIRVNMLNVENYVKEISNEQLMEKFIDFKNELEKCKKENITEEDNEIEIDFDDDDNEDEVIELEI